MKSLTPKEKLEKLREEKRELEEARDKEIKEIWERMIDASNKIGKLLREQGKILEKAKGDVENVRKKYQPQIKDKQKGIDEISDEAFKRSILSKKRSFPF